MLDGLDLYSLRHVLPSYADRVAHSRPVVNMRPTALREVVIQIIGE